MLESNISDIIPTSIAENIAGNYDIYLKSTLPHILFYKKFLEKNPLQQPLLSSKKPKISLPENKKILILDLDETLIHAEFLESSNVNINNKDEKDNMIIETNEKYDTVLSFYSEIPSNNSNDNYNETNSDNTTDDESKDDSCEKELTKVGIFLRPKLKEFLEEISKFFYIGIFTASVPEYADAIINYLDPEEKYIKFRLYRNDCAIINNALRTKDLKIFGENINLKNIVLIDNNIYSFIPQMNNGILINSFFGNKLDDELTNVSRYLIDYILPCDDVREVNDTFFGFNKIMEKLRINRRL